MKKLFIPVIFILFLHGFTFAAGSKEIDPIYSGNESGPYKILILVEVSEYKFALAQSIEKELSKTNESFITTDDLGSYTEYELDQYSALLIINAGKAGNVDGKVKKILKQSEKKKIVVMTTWGGKHDPPDIGVDSISGASKQENIEDITRQLLSLLEKYLR